MAELPLYYKKQQIGVVLCDEEDYNDLKKYRIFTNGSFRSKTRYPCINYAGKHIYVHRYIMKLFNYVKGELCDHINRNTFDARKSNLRIVNYRQNIQNQGLRSDNNSSIKNVGWHTKLKCWVATITYNKKKYHLGLFNDIKEAEMAVVKIKKDLNYLTNSLTSSHNDDVEKILEFYKQNKRMYRRNNSGFVGVSYNRQQNKWIARIYFNKQTIYVGVFETAEKANAARLLRIKELKLENKIYKRS